VQEKRGIAPHSLNLGERSTSNFVAKPPKQHLYPFDEKLSGPQNVSGWFGEEQNLYVSLPTFEPRIIQLLAQSLH
jgi:hypothetical protein